MKVTVDMRCIALLAAVLLVSGCTTKELRAPAVPDEPPVVKKETPEPVQVLDPVEAPIEPNETIPAAPPESLPITLEGPVFIERLCREVGNKLGSVSSEDCTMQQLRHSATSVEGRSLAYKDYASDAPLGRVLLIGGIHGDEFSSISLTFRWMEILNEHHSGLFRWRFIPLANPDGLLQKESQRQNSNGVDLNRNFPTTDWNDDAHEHWVTVASRNPRRHPGRAGGSEIETQWIVSQIEAFQPDIIVSVHAPHHLVDYDGPPRAPEKLGSLSLQRLGVFPGSLGNFAGIDLNLPVVTVELQFAGIMPPRRDIDRMWMDLVAWLQRQMRESQPSATARAD